MSMVQQVLELEGFRVIVVHTAQEALAQNDQHGERYLVLMDNYHNNPHAQYLATTIFATPDLHARVKIVGFAVSHWAGLIPLDEYLPIPFTIDALLESINRLCTSWPSGA
jgi:CheY-like chemotaxis protein